LKEASKEFEDIQKTYQDTLTKAMNARMQFRQSMKDVFESGTYQFIEERFEEPDVNELNRICQYLHKSRLNPTLIYNDGLLDVRTILETQFGRELISHDNILRTPLIFFLCGFFFLPNFYHQSRIYIISQWGQLIDENFDIRTFDNNVLFFYCPNRNQYDCALLKFLNKPQKLTITILSLSSDTNTNDLRLSLEEIFPDGINIDIENDYLDEIDEIYNNDNQHRFSLSCLMKTLNK
ncbi:unnamed protein product, partial [Rotaria sp. Silwood2]